MAEELRLTAEAQDKIAKIVLERTRRAFDRQQDYKQFQDKSVWFLKYRAQKQYNREYIASDAADFQEAFGIDPTRYYGVVQQKTNATWNWGLDLVLPQLDAMAVCTPSPDPDIDKNTRERIRFFLMQEVYEHAQQSGLADLNLLLTSAGKVDDRVKYFLQERALALKKAEQAKIVAAAGQAAQRMQIRMRDISVEGGFRQAYSAMKFDQSLYGMGYMRFPLWRMRPYVEYSGSGVKRSFVKTPMFKHVSVHDFFPLDDGETLQTNTGNTEITSITKAQLIQCARMEGYNKQAIVDVLTEFQKKSRGWIGILQESSDRNDDVADWELDEQIPMLIHEGFFSGGELEEYGIHGVDELDYVDARIEVVGGRTIRCEMIRAPNGESRTYFGAAFIKTGTNLFDYVGLAGMLWDTEQRVNRIMHCFEHNIDWASRPPLLFNGGAFSDPNVAYNIRPGYKYSVEERFGVTGSMPDALRPMNAVSAQYHLIMTQVGQLLRQADEDCGIPAFAYSAQDMGRSSLGEYTQRVSNALRTIKGMAINEDMYLIEPLFTELFQYLMISEPELRDGQDINLQVRGITGLLKEDLQAQQQKQVLPTLIQARAQGVPNLDKAVEYSVRQLLSQAGFPIDALGLTDPVIENALAVAANQPVQGVQPGGNQVPTLDGRSGVPSQNVAQPNGISSYNLSQIAPI
ncbi:MAG: hypothetical protein NC080_07505 [Paraprevotella sp.]|nr:hypothetical protein [Paraprevotella sp.]